jgi:hypothetical protein
MSIRIALDNPPEFYTNLDYVQGRIVLSLNRPEQVGNIVVKLEGESNTALIVPSGQDPGLGPPRTSGLPGGLSGNITSENHKLLYRVQQVFPDEQLLANSTGSSYVLQAGQHEYPFRFKLPFNNACSNPVAMSKLGGLGGVGGFGTGGGLFGLGGIRVMDGSKQLFLQHVTKTLPPSLTGFPGEAEVRYYVKVTIQRPGFLKENWRYQVGFKFLPIEPPRPKNTSQEAFARRPFAFKPRMQPAPQRKKSSLFSSSKDNALQEAQVLPPSVEMSARLPHPSILTCNQPIPLRLISKKLNPSNEQIHLTSLQIDLIGNTEVRCHDLRNREVNRWVVVSKQGLNIPLIANPQTDEAGTELDVPDSLWNNASLPNTVAPSFVACNLARNYELELKLGLTWVGPPLGKSMFSSKDNAPNNQTIHLPLHLSKIQVYSGIAPPPELVEAMRNSTNRPSAATLELPPRLPPRTHHSAPVAPTQGQMHAQAPVQPVQQVQPYDPLYPPQIGAPSSQAFDEAPPSYDEAMAENVTGPFDGLRPRPAYSGVTNENAPSQISEKS